MKTSPASRHRGQAGYTLIELVIASGLGVIVMASLTSVVLTAVVASNTATSRVEASGQIRNFELTAYDDFARSQPPAPCGSASKPCSVPLVLQAPAVPNPPHPAPARVVKYIRNGSILTRSVTTGGQVVTRTLATDVTTFGWYVEGIGPQASVVVNLTITLGGQGLGRFYNVSTVQSQTLRFFPRVTVP